MRYQQMKVNKVETEVQSDPFSIITDYEAFLNSIEETLLIGEIGLECDEKEVTRATLAVMIGHITQLANHHKKTIEEHYLNIGVESNVHSD